MAGMGAIAFTDHPAMHLLLLATTTAVQPPVWLLLPFCLLLLGLASCPLLMPAFWEHRGRQIIVALSCVPVLYYLIAKAGATYLHVAADYGSFMVVIGALFVISGGVHLRVKGEAKPWMNCLFLLIGAVLGNFIGTTGASMLLIRPWIRMNKYRFTGMHVAFFIFLVSNIGGCLTPIGDPPLLIGYLKGVPFWWVIEHCWKAWCLAIGGGITIFYFLDRRNFLRAPKVIREAETSHGEWHADGLHNVFFMLIVITSILVLPEGLRELAMTVAAVASYVTTKKPVHEANHFSFAPLKEVAWIFLGIFATMKPVLDYMVLHAANLGLKSDAQFYWLTGLLSGVLDNAPTYLTFLAAAFGIENLNLDRAEDMHIFIAHHDHYLIAISIGSVFFGALTYIGNGPNLMVKAICEQAKVNTPHFFEYIFKYSLPVLIPVFVLVSWLLFH